MPLGSTSKLANLPVWTRPARPNERLDLEELMHRASTAVPEYRDQLLENPEAIDLPMSQVKLGQVVVAESVVGNAGFAVVVVNDDGVELDGLFVEPHLWGRGVGKALVDIAVHVARREGLSLTVIAAPGARQFYERCGFAFESETQTRFGPALIMSR